MKGISPTYSTYAFRIFVGVEEAEPLLKTELHLDCTIELLPQREEEHVDETV